MILVLWPGAKTTSQMAKHSSGTKAKEDSSWHPPHIFESNCAYIIQEQPDSVTQSFIFALSRPLTVR